MTIRKLQGGDADRLVALFRALSDEDLTLMREDLYDLDATARLADEPRLRWVSVDDDGAITGYAAIEGLRGWSDHVGELRIVVTETARGAGTGRLLARAAIAGALAARFTKVVVEFPAESESSIGTFLDLGFTGEALLRDQIRDRAGRFHDIVTLALHAGDAAALAQTVGVTAAID